MSRSILRVLPVFVATIYACGMGMFWALTRLALPGTAPAVGDPGAYITAGLLGVAVLLSLNAQERRIRELEERLRDPSAPAAEPPAAR